MLRPRRRPRTASAPLLALSLALSLALAACGGADEPDAAATDAPDAVVATATDDTSPNGSPGTSPVSRSIRFVTLPGDTITIVAGEDPALRLVTFAPTEGGFVRGLVPVLLQNRRIARVDADAPFTLLRTPDGLLIADPSTGERIDLEAFGPDALRIFDALLHENSAGDVTP